MKLLKSKIGWPIEDTPLEIIMVLKWCLEWRMIHNHKIPKSGTLIYYCTKELNNHVISLTERLVKEVDYRLVSSSILLSALCPGYTKAQTARQNHARARQKNCWFSLEKLHVTRVSYSPSYTTKYLFGSKKRKVKAATQQEIYLLLVFFFMIQLFVWIPTWRVH